MSQATIPDLPFDGSPPSTVLFEISNGGVSESTDLASIVFGLQNISEKDIANGYAGLDASGLLNPAQIPDLSGTYQILTEKDIANGYAGLDATGLLLLGTIPNLPQSRIVNLISDLALRELLANKVTTIGTPGNDTNYPTEKATRDALDLKQDTLLFTPEDIANKVITVGTPGNDTNYPSEKAVRDALNLKQDTLLFTPEDIANKVTVIGTPGNDTNYPTEKAARDALDLKEDSLGFTPEDIANKATDLLLPDNIKYATTLAITTDLLNYQLLSGKGAINGYAGLDGAQELLIANFPTGAALQFLRRNAANTALEFAASGSVSPLTTKGDVYTFDTGDARLPVGADGFILSANSVQATGLEWIVAPVTSPLTTKGDLYTFDSVNQRLAVGIDGQILEADSAEATGLKWVTAILGITSLNADTATAQTLSGGDGISITDLTPDHSFAVDATVARDSDNLSFFSATTSAQLAGVISDETGTGLVVFGTAPVIITPTIASFVNAVHDHSDAAGGGQLTNTALIAGVFSSITGLGVQTQILNMGNFAIQALLPPTNGTDAATKTYVDDLVNGLAWKDAAIVATTGNITLSGEQTIDGVLTSASRVLVKNQTSGQENGVYDSGAGAWVRTTDADTDVELVNMSIFIESGVTQTGTAWTQTVPLPITVDTTVLNYAQVGAGPANPLTTKGDLFGYDTENQRVPVGTNGQVLTANSVVALGLEWQTPTVGDVVGPGSSTDEAITLFDGITGKLIKNSNLIYDVSNSHLNLTGALRIIAGGSVPAGTETYLREVGSDLVVNVTALGSILLNFGTANNYEFDQDQLDLNSNNLVNAIITSASTLNGTAVATAALSYANGLKQTFNPSGANAGLNFGSETGDPSTTFAGDVWYNSTLNKFRANENGVDVDMIGGGGGDVVGPVSSTDNAIATFNLATGKVIQQSGASLNPVLIDDSANITQIKSVQYVNNSSFPSFNFPYTQFGNSGTGTFDLENNVPTGSEHSWHVGGTQEYNMTATDFFIFNNNIIQTTGYYQMQAMAAPASSGSALVGRLYQDLGNSNHLTISRNGVPFDLESGGGEVFTWTANHDAARFNLTSTGAIDFHLSGPIVTPAATQPYIMYDTVPTPDGMKINVPAAREIALTFANVREYDFTTTVFDVHGNQIDNVSIFTSNAGSPAVTGVIRLGNNEEVTWRNAANTGQNSIYYNASNEFQIEITNGVDYSFSETEFDANGNNVVGVGNLTLADNLFLGNSGVLPGGTTTSIWWDGSAYMGFNVPNADEYRLYINASEEYSFSQTTADFFSNSLINATITGATNTISGISEAMQTVAVGAAATVLTSNGVGVAPTYQAVVGAGDVVGPGSATDNAIARYNLTTGKLIQDSTVTIDDDGDTVFPRSIQFVNSATLPSSTLVYMQRATSALRTNVPTGSTYVWTIEGASEMNLSVGGLNLQDKNLTMGTGYIDLEEIATPTLPVANVGRLYTKDVATETHLFFINSSGEDTDLVEHALQTPWTSDIDAARFNLESTGAIDFHTSGAISLPAITQPYITFDDSLAPDAMVTNVPTGAEQILSFNGVEEYTFTNSIFDMHLNQLSNVSFIILTSATAPTLRFNRSTALVGDAAAGEIQFRSGNQIYGEILSSPTNIGGGDETGTMKLRVAQNSFEYDMISLIGSTAGPSFGTISFHQNKMASQINMGGNVLQEVLRIESDATNKANAGFLRLGNNELLAFRNNANSANHSITFNASDQFVISITSASDYLFSETSLNMVGNALQNPSEISDVSGNAIIDFGTAGASAVNEITITNAITATSPIIAATGTDANVDLSIRAKGEGSIVFADTDGFEETLKLVQVSGAAINFVEITNSLTGIGPIIAPQGQTDIDLNIQSKGTGLINLNATTDLLGNNLESVQNIVHDQSVITYNATLAFDFDLDQEQTLAVTGDLTTLTTSNRAAGKSKSIFITGDTVNRTLTFNASWRTNPATATVTITANTFGLLTFGCKGAAETDVFCAYAEFV